MTYCTIQDITVYLKPEVENILVDKYCYLLDNILINEIASINPINLFDNTWFYIRNLDCIDRYNDRTFTVIEIFNKKINNDESWSEENINIYPIKSDINWKKLSLHYNMLIERSGKKHIEDTKELENKILSLCN